MEPREFVDQELKVITELFNVQKEIYPMVILLKDDNRYQIPVHFTSSAARKDIISQGIKDLVKKSEPDVVIYVAEAWVKFVKQKSDRVAAPYTDTDKAEILVVQIEFKSGEKFACEARIDRTGNFTQLHEFEICDHDISMGRFVDFFPIKRYN